MTVDVLRRMSIVELARELGRLDELQQVCQFDVIDNDGADAQMSLLMEPKTKYRTIKVWDGGLQAPIQLEAFPAVPSTALFDFDRITN